MLWRYVIYMLMLYFTPKEFSGETYGAGYCVGLHTITIAKTSIVLYISYIWELTASNIH